MNGGRNREGYADPTATIAIGNVEREERRRGDVLLESYDEHFNGEAFICGYMTKKNCNRTLAMQEIRRKIPKESYYQEKIKKALKRRYPDCFVVKIAQGMYSEGGIPDVMCIVDGHYFGFEVKRPLLGKPTKLQEKRIQQIADAGGTAAIVSWPEECFRIIDNWRFRDVRMDYGD